MSEVPFQQTRASLHLDALRAIAALVVMVSHWRNLFFVLFSAAPNNKQIGTRAFYLLTQGGHTSVVIFFVLSGYLIAGSVLRGMRKGNFSFPLYVTHRLARLWAVLIPALILGGLLDYIGIHASHAHDLYAGLVQDFTTGNTIHNLTLGYALKCLFFLQKNPSQVFGSNGALWSLAYEFWYYILFPIGLMLLSARDWAKRGGLLLALILVAMVAGVHILLLFPLWLFGAALHFIPHRRLSHITRVLAAGGFVCGFIVLTVSMHRFTSETANYAIDMAMGLVTALFLWIVLSSREKAEKGIYERVSRVVSGFSYTLYAMHLPVLLLFAAFTVGNGLWLPDLPHILLAGIGLVIATLWSYVMSQIFEKRTAWVQLQLYRPLAFFSLRKTPVATGS